MVTLMALPVPSKPASSRSWVPLTVRTRDIVAEMWFRRFDGSVSHGVPAYRRMVPFLMRRKNESAVYFEQTIDLSKTLPWIESFNEQHDDRITVFHVFLAAMARTLFERPRLNRFVSGRRIHDREGVWISFAAKKRFDDDAPLSVVKRRFDPDETFAEMVKSLTDKVDDARSDRRSSVDKEIGALLKLPTALLDGAVQLIHALDFFNLAPTALLKDDPMYTSVFCANLGSLKIDAAYHHLYEHGNCPLFVTLGVVEKAPVVIEGDVIEVHSVVKLKFTYDERIEDGMYCARALQLLEVFLADPAAWAGD